MTYTRSSVESERVPTNLFRTRSTRLDPKIVSLNRSRSRRRQEHPPPSLVNPPTIVTHALRDPQCDGWGIQCRHSSLHLDVSPMTFPIGRCGCLWVFLATKRDRVADGEIHDQHIIIYSEGNYSQLRRREFKIFFLLSHAKNKLHELDYNLETK